MGPRKTYYSSVCFDRCNPAARATSLSGCYDDALLLVQQSTKKKKGKGSEDLSLHSGGPHVSSREVSAMDRE